MIELLINVQGLQTYYGASHILRGVNFTVGRGETIPLMGRNGMGKSTLLKSIVGLVPPRGGSVSIMGRPMAGRPPFEVARFGGGLCARGAWDFWQSQRDGKSSRWPPGRAPEASATGPSSACWTPSRA